MVVRSTATFDSNRNRILVRATALTLFPIQNYFLWYRYNIYIFGWQNFQAIFEWKCFCSSFFKIYFVTYWNLQSNCLKLLLFFALLNRARHQDNIHIIICLLLILCCDWSEHGHMATLQNWYWGEISLSNTQTQSFQVHVLYSQLKRVQHKWIETMNSEEFGLLVKSW